MHWAIAEELTRTRDLEMRDGAARRRFAPPLPRHAGDRIAIRRSGPGDGPALATLAALEEREWPGGPAVVAEIDGSVRAALTLDGGEPFADPFFETADAVALLRVRAEQLGGAAPRESRLRRFRPAWAAAR
jgi:hypothetical protein